MLFSIGYQGLTLKQLIQLLDDNQIELLVDVRSRPYSHNPQFNKNNLMRVLGNRYMWWGRSLGGKTGIKQAGYNSSLLWLFNTSKTKNVCVMCMEADPNTCHRKLWIADDIEQKYGVSTTHISTKEIRRKRSKKIGKGQTRLTG